MIISIFDALEEMARKDIMQIFQVASNWNKYRLKNTD